MSHMDVYDYLKGSVPFFPVRLRLFGLDIAKVTASKHLSLPTSGVRKKQFVMQWTLKAAVNFQRYGTNLTGTSGHPVIKYPSQRLSAYLNHDFVAT